MLFFSAKLYFTVDSRLPVTRTGSEYIRSKGVKLNWFYMKRVPVVKLLFSSSPILLIKKFVRNLNDSHAGMV